MAKAPLSAKRMAAIQKWRLLGAQARRGRRAVTTQAIRGKNLQARENYHKKRNKRGTGVIGSYGRATAWGVQKMVMPIGIGGPIVALAKNRIPGYNQYQILKSSGHTATGAKHIKRARPRKRR